GICVGGGTTVDPSTGSGSTGPSATDSSGSATGSAMTTEGSSSNASVDSGGGTTESTTASASSSSGEPTCADERDCEACFACAVAVIGPCADDAMACSGDDQCQGLQTCVTNCASMAEGEQCVEQCCGLFEDGDMPPYSDLSSCVNEACGELCSDFAC
ncbi:MAG TPA: hypothetical protein VFG69_04070, partial [Nannocystaceae bacterium]|nr:hypothetical protein [Nannocystaceae bacterium]